MAKVASMIEQYNNERPNQVADEIKLFWLKKVEQIILHEVIETHEYDDSELDSLSLKVSGNTLHIQKAGSLSSHLDSFGMDTELLVKAPYDDLYMYYIDQRIAYNANDMRRYNAAATKYNDALLNYQQYINRNYKTKVQEKRLLRHENL